ncbi:outer membrane receptor protein involved in Fe transport [Novosphingobium sp. PhB165]|uniref:TonB-dependent receptor domain-containing protein n=1 Tax=Novosphingobium sp. PhB165 TaxID=2485105 RepID=UPI001047413D|nr:TonB-dependent receptor [Novosphingobium sp. PhB165]TCM16148.1 outer membrane receptor protein involved in Fe transport [Novosphingobium sp. PhB165]
MYKRAMRLLAAAPCAVTALACTVQPLAAREQEAVQGPTQVRTFDIPAGNLASALDEFGHQAGVQILYPYAQAARLRSPGLHGRMRARAALDALLRGQPLAVARFEASLVVLRPAPAGKLAPPPAPPRITPPAPRPAAPPPVTPPEDIVVTGRAVNAPLLRSELSYALTDIDHGTVMREGAVSTAALFQQIPGFWVEASGGEASNNVRARGIPTDGYSSVAILEDGLPVQYDGGLGYLNTDQVFRTDASVERAEAVRGGPSAVFVPNAPGGSVNFLTRNPLKHPGVDLSMTGGSFGYARIDGYAGVRLGPNLGLGLGGFYRTDAGPRDPGYNADRGGQLRASLAYDDGRLKIDANVKHLDDRVILYLPVPLQFGANGRVEPIHGFDPLRDTLAGPDNVHVAFLTPQGPQDFDLSQGTTSRITFYSLSARLALGSRSAIELRTRLRTGTTRRSGLFPIGRPTTAEDYIASAMGRLRAAWPDTTAARIQYADDGAAFTNASNGNGLVVGANLMAVQMPLREGMADARFTTAFELAGHHDLAIGTTFDAMDMKFDRQTGTVLLDVRGQARRLDVLALDSAGQVLGALTDNGFVRYGSLYNSATLNSRNVAIYGADEWKLAPDWRLDFGARWEHVRIGGGTEETTTVDLGDAATLADDAVLTGTGVIDPVGKSYSGLSWTLAANYRPAPGVGTFARFTRTLRLPAPTDFTDNAQGTDLAPVPITMAEAGLTLERRSWNLTAVAFRSHFARLPFTDYRFDTASNAYIEQTSIADTTTWGLELSGQARLAGPLRLDWQATLQDPRYHNFRYTQLDENGNGSPEDADGHQLIRVPRLSLRASPSLDLFGGKMTFAMDFLRFSQRFSDVVNTQRLPAYSMINARIRAALPNRFELSVQFSNITNSLGLTEGNPRVGSFDAGGSTGYFLARPEFARAARMTLAWRY